MVSARLMSSSASSSPQPTISTRPSTSSVFTTICRNNAGNLIISTRCVIETAKQQVLQYHFRQAVCRIKRRRNQGRFLKVVSSRSGIDRNTSCRTSVSYRSFFSGAPDRIRPCTHSVGAQFCLSDVPCGVRLNIAGSVEISISRLRDVVQFLDNACESVPAIRSNSEFKSLSPRFTRSANVISGFVDSD